MPALTGSSTGDPGQRSDPLESLSRALTVLELIDESDAPVTASEVCRATGIGLPMMLRLLRSLTALGHLEYDDRRYRISDGSLSLSWSYLSALDLESILRPALSSAASKLRLPGFFAVLTLPYVYHVDMVLSEEWRSFTGGRAARAPAHVTSAGYVLLAALDDGELQTYLDGQHRLAYTEHSVVDRSHLRDRVAQVREAGFAITDGEYVPGLRGIAVPVHNADDSVIGAFTISTNAVRTSLEALQGVVKDELLRAADEAHRQYAASRAAS